MKNLKKVLALALAFVMCFTMFAGAAVYSDVPAGSDYSEAVTLLSDLGVIAGKPDGSYGVNDTITRADAACLIARMMTGETTPSKYAGASNFTDVAKDAYYESSVAYCAIMGITSGTGNGQYSPLRTITDGEFIAMVTRALGYDTAENPLSFPMGNIAVAQQEGLLDGVNCVASSPALRGEDAQIIYNALFADYDRYAKSNNIYQGSDDEHPFTIAEEVFDLARLAVAKEKDIKKADFFDKDERDDMTCESHKWVVVGKDNTEADTYVAYKIMDKDDEITDEALTFEYTGDAEPIYGYEVELWGKTSHTGDDREVVAIKTVKGQSAYDYNPTMDDDDDDDTIELKDKDLDIAEKNDDCKKAVLKIDGDEFYDPTDDEEIVYDLEDVKEADLNEKNGFTYKLIDWDGDDKIDFVVVTERYYAQVTDVDDDDIVLEAVDGDEEFEIDGDNVKVVGDKVEEDDVVEITVTRSYDKKEGEIVTLNLTKIKSEDKELDSYTVKANEFYFDDSDDPMYWAVDEDWHAVEEVRDDLEKGDEYALFLNKNGYIIKVDDPEEDSAGYLMVLNTTAGKNYAKDEKDELAEVKVLLADGTIETYEVTQKLKIDGENNGKTGYDKDDFTWAEELVVGKVFKYSIDKDVITKLTSAVGQKNKSAGKYEDVDGLEAEDYYFRDKNERLTIGNTNYTIKSSAPVFLAVDDYIKADGANGGIKVDEDKVKVVKATELPNISHPDDAPDYKVEAAEMTSSSASNYLDKDALKVLTSEPSDDKHEISVALLGVDSLRHIQSNVKVALVTDVRVGKDNSVLFGAYNGKTDNKKAFATVDDDPEEIFFQMGTNGTIIENNKGEGLTENDLDHYFYNDDKNMPMGRYAEVYSDSEGKITKVVFMAKGTEDYSSDSNKAVNVDTYFGDIYTVHRAAVITTENDEISVLEKMTYNGKDSNGNHTAALEANSDDTLYKYYDVEKEVEVYTIKERPVMKQGDVIAVTDDFDTDEELYKNISAGKSMSDVKASNIKYTYDKLSKIYFADIVLDEDEDVSAIFSFTKELYKADDRTFSLASTSVSKKFDEDMKDETVAINFSADYTSSDKKSAKATIEGTAPAGLKVEVKDGKVVINSEKNTTPIGEYTVKVTCKEASATLTVKVTKAAADEKAESIEAAEQKLADAQQKLTEAETKAADAKKAAEDATAAYNAAKKAAEDKTQVDKADNALTAAKKAAEDAQDALDAAKTAFEEDKSSIVKYEQYKDAKAAKEAADKELEAAKAAKDQADADFAKAKENATTAEANMIKAIATSNQAEQAIKPAKDAVDAAQAELDELKK